MANVGMTGRGTVFVGGVEVPLPEEPISSMAITGDGVWINGVRQEAGGAAQAQTGGKAPLQISVLGCKIGRLEIKNCRTTGAEFKDCEVQRVSSTAASLTIAGNVKGDVKSQSGDVTCEGTIGGNAKTMSGDVRAKAIQGSASTISGSVYGANKEKVVTRPVREVNVVRHGAAGSNARYIYLRPGGGSNAVRGDLFLGDKIVTE